MKRYESYQPSGTAWLEYVPVTWNVQKIGALFSQRKVKVSDRDYAPLSVSKGGIVPQMSTAAKTDDGDNRKRVRTGDFVINSRSDRKGSCGVSPLDGSVSLINIVLEPRQEWNSRYVHYLLRSQPFSEEYYRNGRGIVADLWTTRYSEMKSILLPVPPLAEQNQIVRYLDWQVSKINTLIAAKKREIELLKEHQTHFVNKAVTQGIDNATLVSSGLNWLPQMPQHWKTIPAKALFKHEKTLRHGDDEMLAATQKYGMIPQKLYMEKEGRRVVLANDNLDKWYHVLPNDFIISLRSFQGGLELCSSTGCVTWHYVVLRAYKTIHPLFYRWFFKSASYIKALQQTSDFIRDGQDLRYSNFIKVRLLDIPLNEQVRISERIDQVVPQYEIVIKKLMSEITTLLEYRTRLISDVVTGQIDVRSIEIPNFEIIEEISTGEDEPVENEAIEEAEEEEE